MEMWLGSGCFLVKVFGVGIKKVGVGLYDGLGGLGGGDGVTAGVVLMFLLGDSVNGVAGGLGDSVNGVAGGVGFPVLHFPLFLARL